MLSMLVYMTMTMLIPGAELLFMCPRGPGTWHCHTSPLQPNSFSSANIIGCEMAEMDICPGFYKWQDVLRDGAHGNLNISLCKFVPIQWEKLMLVSGVYVKERQQNSFSPRYLYSFHALVVLCCAPPRWPGPLHIHHGHDWKLDAAWCLAWCLAWCWLVLPRQALFAVISPPWILNTAPSSRPGPGQISRHSAIIFNIGW